MRELTLTINITIDDTGRLEASACDAFTGIPCRSDWRRPDEPADDELRALACIAMLPLARKFVGHDLPVRV